MHWGSSCWRPWIAGAVLHTPALTGILRFGAIYTFFFTLNGYQIGAIAGFEAFSRLVKVNVVLGPSRCWQPWD